MTHKERAELWAAEYARIKARALKLVRREYKRNEVWTRRCELMVSCGWDGERRNPEQAAYVADDQRACDSCLGTLFGLGWEERRHEHCDQLGMGPEYIEADLVDELLRRVYELVDVQNGELVAR